MRDRPRKRKQKHPRTHTRNYVAIQVFGAAGDPTTVCNWMSVLMLITAVVLGEAYVDAVK
jgi:hypothetical protein